jgi:RNA recognition motif-containing protein
MCHRLEVEHLPDEVDEEHLDMLFGLFGEVIERKVIRYPVTGVSTGRAYVTLREEEAAREAMALLGDGSVGNPPLRLYLAQQPLAHRLQEMAVLCSSSGETLSRIITIQKP